MTLGDYVEAIASSKITNDSKAKIVTDLFIVAGRTCEFTKDTANSWLNGERRCKTSRYFPNGKIENEVGLINYFKNRPKVSQKALQEAFRPINIDGIVNCDTNDREEFCRSLLYQFMAILCIPWPEKVVNNIPTASDDSVSTSDNIEVETLSHMKNLQLDQIEDKVMDQSEPGATLSGWDGSTTAYDILMRSLPPSVLDFSEKLIGRQIKRKS